MHIEKLDEYSDFESDVDFTLFVARPSKVPGTFGGKVTHFFTDRSTSTFMVFRKANVLSVEVRGRNEVPNTNGQNILDMTRNLIVNGGSAIGMPFAQWHLLVSGIVNPLL